MKHASIRPSLHETLDLMQGAYAPNTIRAVRADVAQWLEYCSAANQPFATASPRTFATFIDQLTQNGQLRASTIRRVASSVACFYRLQGLPDITKSPLAALALRRMYRTLGRRMRHAKPINAELLHRLLSACAGPSLMDLRNQALLRIAHDTLLRRSELVSLRIEDLEIRSDQMLSTRGGWTKPDTVLRYIEQTPLEPHLRS
jgi:site-specific recombinase XerD